MPRKRVTRLELHRQVWEKPLTELSKEYDVTGTGLAKICDRHGIPRPSQGHWIKLEAGKHVKVKHEYEQAVRELEEQLYKQADG